VIRLADVRLSLEEYLSLMDRLRETKDRAENVVSTVRQGVKTARKVKKKTSAYNRKYKAAFKKVSNKYRTKAGKWKKGGFKQAVKAAHKMAGKK
tara:strand:- start:2118 stop:2399 length:282 start_codon:yes stop_codon:yes gene_type:complete